LKYGANELVERSLKSPWLMLWEQLTGSTMLLLLVAAAISAALGASKDTLAILAIVVLSALLGFSQDYQASHAIAALRKLTVPTVRTCRERQWQEISAPELVPGDLIRLEAGSLVPADCRLVESVNLRVQEAAFTGESEPVEKVSHALSREDLPLGDRTNMIYMGTIITYGRGRAVVTETGMNTELGSIAHLVQTVDQEPTPLQKRLEQLGQKLVLASLAIVAVIFVLGLFRGEPIQLMFLTAVSVAVAIVPEALPAVVTIALAIGSQRMLKRHALIRKLPAVETLGSVTVICADKTGTLTENCMTVTTIFDPSGKETKLANTSTFSQPPFLSGTTASPNAPALPNTSNWPEAFVSLNVPTLNDPSLSLILIGSTLCTDALLLAHRDLSGHFRALGDPTETALVIAATKFGLLKNDLEARFPRIAEIPFESRHRLMTTIHQISPPASQLANQTEIHQTENQTAPISPFPSTPCSPVFCPLPPTLFPLTLLPLFPSSSAPSSSAPYSLPPTPLPTPYSPLPTPYIAFTKGSVSNLLEVSHQVWLDGQIHPLTKEGRDRILSINNQLAQQGIRVLGMAFRLFATLPNPPKRQTIEQDLVFVGLVGMLDPARLEVKQAVRTCKMAGICPVMITGDHPLIAQHIATELGIISGESIGNELMADAATPTGRVLTGLEIEQLSLEELAKQVEGVSVYARVSPEEKLKIVHAFQSQGHIVAMTGDGVNDAPSLKKADIGVAMGVIGTDVAKESADMILLNDNFTTIVAAIAEGRVIYDNIRKFIKYSMTGNAGGVWVMLLAPFLEMPLPLLPLQILWINLLADGLLALALSIEPAELNIMNRPPYHPNENIFSRGMGKDIVGIGLLMGLVTLGLGYEYWSGHQEIWQTMIFSNLACARANLALAMRSDRDCLFQIGPLSNKPMLATALLTLGLQMAVVYLPSLQALFQTTPLPIRDLGICLITSTIPFWAIELKKWLIYRKQSP
jgi:Ca2+-transporting ATPase